MTVARVLFGLGLAALIALLLPTTAHGDLFISAFNSTLIFTDDPNFYEAIADGPTALFPTGLSGGPYGPLFYYPTAAWLWVADALQIIDADGWDGTDDASLQSLPTILVLKLPNLLVYALTALVLAKTLRGERGRVAMWLWLANPAVILFTLMMGQNDGWAALAALAALYFGLRAIEGRMYAIAGRELSPAIVAMAALAIGGAIKLSPVLLVPAFALLLGRSHRERALLGAAGAGGFLLLVAPFLGSGYFWDHGLFGRQEGQAPDIALGWTVVLYVAALATVFAVSLRDERRERVLLFAFLGLLALLYLLPDWSPQRSVLFLGALAVAVPWRRAFVVPYLFVTAFAFVSALERGNTLAVGLFAPLTERVELIPPLFDRGRLDPWYSLLYALGGASWVAALATLWSERPPLLPSLRWSVAVPAALVAVLVVYVAVTAAFLPRGVRATPYAEPAPALEVGAGETLELSALVGRGDLRAITLRTENGSTAAVRVQGAAGPAFVDDAFAIAPGENRIEVDTGGGSQGVQYRVSVTPEDDLRVVMSQVPEEFVVASAELDGVALETVPSYTLHHETSWRALFEDAASGLRDEWATMLVSAAFVFGAAGVGVRALHSDDG